MDPYDLIQRTKKFAIDVILFSNNIPTSFICQHIIKQLLRS